MSNGNRAIFEEFVDPEGSRKVGRVAVHAARQRLEYGKFTQHFEGAFIEIGPFKSKNIFEGLEGIWKTLQPTPVNALEHNAEELSETVKQESTGKLVINMFF